MLLREIADVNPDLVDVPPSGSEVSFVAVSGFSVSGHVLSIGHWGTGELEVKIRSQQDIEDALPLIQWGYEGQS